MTYGAFLEFLLIPQTIDETRPVLARGLAARNHPASAPVA